MSFRRCAGLLIVLAGCGPTGDNFGTPTDDALPGATDDGGTVTGHDLAVKPPRDGGTVRDGTVANPDLTTPVTGPDTVGAQGGSVNLLHFGLSGDTRPMACEDTASYPTTIISGIGDQMRKRKVQFSMDLGDHMYVCNNDVSIATKHMQLFQQGTAHFGGTWFMTMGNHECWKGPCLIGSQNANYVAYMNALKPISPTRPYYSFDVQTSQGLATFVVIADNAWDQAQATWLNATLTTADARARYTIIARHHPPDDTSVATNPDSAKIVRQHKFALWLTGHSHLYHHYTQLDGGRDMVLGNAGAPLIAGGTFYGYSVVDQQPNGQLLVQIYDLVSSNLVDSWSVGPNQ